LKSTSFERREHPEITNQKVNPMSNILVLYYSMYGHIETLAGAIAEGARSVEGAEVFIKRVPETIPLDVAAKSGAKVDQIAPVASPNELSDYDAILFGTLHLRGLAIWLGRCEPSSIKLGASGPKAHEWARSPASSVAQAPVAATSPRS
jgi:hypothetical protein